jgi:hypothetical protein
MTLRSNSRRSLESPVLDTAPEVEGTEANPIILEGEDTALVEESESELEREEVNLQRNEADSNLREEEEDSNSDNSDDQHDELRDQEDQRNSSSETENTLDTAEIFQDRKAMWDRLYESLSTTYPNQKGLFAIYIQMMLMDEFTTVLSWATRIGNGKFLVIKHMRNCVSDVTNHEILYKWFKSHKVGYYYYYYYSFY